MDKEFIIDKEILKKRLIKKGLLISGVILLIMGIGLYFVYKEGDMKKFRSILAPTIIASALGGFNTIYEYDVWSLKKKLFTHTLCMMFTALPALFISGWFDLSKTEGYFALFGSFILFGIIGATVGYIVSKYVIKNVPVK